MFVFLEDKLSTKIRDIVNLAAGKLMIMYEKQWKMSSKRIQLLPGRINNKWLSTSSFSCLTGNAQIAIIWLKTYQLNKDNHYLNSAIKLIEQLKKVQNLKSTNTAIRGGIAGSYPIWGKYMPYSYPNWATKFFADALILEEQIRSEKVNKQI